MKGVVEREGAQAPAWQVEELTARYDRLAAEGQEAQQPPDVHQVACRQARSLLRRLARRKDEVLSLLSDPAVPFDNNLAERDLHGKAATEGLGLLPHGGRRAPVLPDQELRLDADDEKAGARGAAGARRGVLWEAAKFKKMRDVVE